jgi:trans-AT polyketide synthase, acyltransferase and oxidoreductase domains
MRHLVATATEWHIFARSLRLPGSRKVMATSLHTHGCWQSQNHRPAFRADDIHAAAHRFREPAYIVHDPATGRYGVALGGEVVDDSKTNGIPHWPLLALLPPLFPEWLGERTFHEVHGTRFPYVAGAMANGIATTRMVIAMGEAGFLGFFGAAGLDLPLVEHAVQQLTSALGDTRPWGCNLIHSPQEPALEEAVANLYLRANVKRVSAAAYVALTPAIVRFALKGLRQDAAGRIVRERHVFAKISRPEVALHFLRPAPDAILDDLVRRGLLDPEEAQLGRRVPVAEDIVVESDSGGHTDNRPLGALFPTVLSLKERAVEQHGYQRPIRVGAAGGLGTPAAVAAAFSMGAAFVLTGSVNQGCVESGLHAAGRRLLADATMADVIMAPAADMFEMGVEVQVLRRGTMFAMRARKLYELYRNHPSYEAIPAAQRKEVEQKTLRCGFDEAWQSTRDFWLRRDPAQVQRAERDPKHKMALVFRSYLGRSSRWAIAGDSDRAADYQIWCGPAMGAFNRWSDSSFLADPEQRSVVQVARNFMEGAAAITRAQQLRAYGLPVPASAFDFRPLPLV